MEHLQHFPLNVAIQVDQQIAADDQIDLGKGRIGKQAVLGKQDLFAHFFTDTVVLALLEEILPKPRRRYVSDDRFRVGTCSAYRNGALVYVGSEYLNLYRVRFKLLMLGAEDCQAVGLFSC